MMLKRIDSNKMGKSNLGWLKSTFHFSFAEYFNPDNMHFGVLRVINDDLILSGEGFPTHPHNNMEIISYVVKGELSHKDSMGYSNKVTRGNIQYMSAGAGIYHSEYNSGEDILRLLQIWILPDKKNYEPSYGDFNFEEIARKNQWLHMVSNKEGNAAIKINNDVNIYATELEEGENLQFNIGKGRQGYLVNIEGESEINGIILNEKDAMEAIEEDLLVKAKSNCHILLLEMKRG